MMYINMSSLRSEDEGAVEKTGISKESWLISEQVVADVSPVTDLESFGEEQSCEFVTCRDSECAFRPSSLSFGGGGLHFGMTLVPRVDSIWNLRFPPWWY